MEFFKSFIKETFIAPEVGDDDGVDIRLIIHRFTTSQVHEDRLASLEELCRYSSSPIYLKEFGSKGVLTLLKSIQKDIDDPVFVNPLLQVLLNLTHSTGEDTLVFTSTYLSALIDNQIVKTLVALLGSKDGYIRLNAIELIFRTLNSDPQVVKEQLLRGGGVERVVSLLNDRDEIITSKAIGLFKDIAKSSKEEGIHSEFSNAAVKHRCFQHLVEIIKDEGCQDGGILTRDCLTIAKNLLTTDYNQKSFVEQKDGYCCSIIPDLINVEGLGDPVPSQIIVLTLEMIQLLLSGYGPSKVVLQKHGVMGSLINLSLRGYPKITKNVSRVRTLAMFCVGFMVNKHRAGQECLEAFTFKRDPESINSSDDILALVRLIDIIVHDWDDEMFRQLAESSLFLFLENNREGQHIVASTIKAPTMIQSETEMGMMAGITLAKAIFSLENPDQLKNPQAGFYACRILSTIIRQNKKLKEVLLALLYDVNRFSTGRGGRSFFTCVVDLTVRGLKDQLNMIPCIGLLVLICDFLRGSPESCAAFMKNSSHFLYFVEVVKEGSVVQDKRFLGLSALLLGLLCLYFPRGRSMEIGGYTNHTINNVLLRKIGMERMKSHRISLEKNFDQQVPTMWRPFMENPFVLFDEVFMKISMDSFNRLENLLENPESWEESQSVNLPSEEEEEENNHNNNNNNNFGGSGFDTSSATPNGGGNTVTAPQVIYRMSEKDVKEKEDLEKKVRKTEISNRMKDRKIRELTNEKKELEKQLDQSISKTSTWEERERKFESEIEQLKKELELQKEIFEQKSEKDSEQLVEKLEKEKEVLKEQLEEKERLLKEIGDKNELEIQKITKTLDEKKQEIKNLSLTFHEMERGMKEKEEQLTNVRNDLSLHQNVHEKLEKENNELKIQLSQGSDWIDKEKKYRAAIDLLKREVEMEKKKAENQKDGNESFVEKIKDELEKKTEVLKEMKEDINTMLELNDELSTRNEELEGKLRENEIEGSKSNSMDEHTRLVLEEEQKARQEEEQRIQEMLSNQNNEDEIIQEPMESSFLNSGLPPTIDLPEQTNVGFVPTMQPMMESSFLNSGIPPTIDLPEQTNEGFVPSLQPVEYNVQPTPIMYGNAGISKNDPITTVTGGYQSTSYQQSSFVPQPTIVSPIVYDAPLQPPPPEIGYGSYGSDTGRAAGGLFLIITVIIIFVVLFVFFAPVLVPCVIIIICAIIGAIVGACSGND